MGMVSTKAVVVSTEAVDTMMAVTGVAKGHGL